MQDFHARIHHGAAGRVLREKDFIGAALQIERADFLPGWRGTDFADFRAGRGEEFHVRPGIGFELGINFVLFVGQGEEIAEGADGL